MEIVKRKEFEKTPVLEVGKWNIPLYFMFALLLFFFGNLGQSVLVQGTGLFYTIFNGGTEEEAMKFLSDVNTVKNFINTNSFGLIVMLFGTLIGIALIIICSKLIDKKKLSDLGMVKKGFFKNYGLGVLIGFVLYSFILLIEVLSGTVKFEGLNAIGVSTLILIPFALGFMIQSFQEELLFRGYLLSSIAAKNCAISSILISSLVFSIVHLLNSSFAILPCINIVLIGIFLGLLYVMTHNIWLVSGFHFIWNYVQGCIYGINVSGIVIQDSLLKNTQVVGHDLLNGGGFGTEGSILTTIVILFVIIGLLIVMYKKKLIVKCNCKK